MSASEEKKKPAGKGAQTALVWIGGIALAAAVLALLAMNLYIASLGILPAKYQLILAAVSGLFCLICLLLLLRGKGRAFRCTLSMILCLVVVALSLTGTLYLRHIYASYSASNETSGQVKTVMAVYVRADAGYTDLSALQGGVLGIGQESPDKTQQLLSQIQELLGENVQTLTYPGITEQVQALKDGSVNAIVINEAMIDAIEDGIDEDFESWAVKLPMTVNIVLEHEIETAAVDVTKDNFIVYISGIDNRGGTVNDTGRSDVNILAVVNPQDKKVLLVNTPRDYYLPLYGDESKMDKLTHAGLYGVDCSMSTLGNLFGVEIPYYVRFNFDSVVRIIDALGGITIYSDYTFYSAASRYGQGYQFYEGENEVSGDAALAFSRSRAFAAGDRVRGKHQQAVITGVINKVTSPAIIKNFNAVLDTVLDNVMTNVSTDDINALIRMQLEDMSSWDVQSISVDGTGDYLMTYSGNVIRYTMVPDMETVQTAIDAINGALAG